MKCEDCKWWDEDDEIEEAKVGFCHRYPPTIEDATCNGEKVWLSSMVYSDDWCGEFKQKVIS